MGYYTKLFNKYQPIAKDALKTSAKTIHAYGIYSGIKGVGNLLGNSVRTIIKGQTQPYGEGGLHYAQAGRAVAKNPYTDKYVVQKPLVNAPAIDNKPVDIAQPDLSALEGVGYGRTSVGDISGGQGYSFEDVVKRASDMQKQINKPQIQELQTQQGTLSKRYDELLASIKGSQLAAENRKTVTTQNELGR